MAENIEQERASNRDSYPAVAKIVDEFRAVFGPGVTVHGGQDFTTGKSFGLDPLVELVGCKGCDGSDCRHPRKAVVFCGFRKAEEVGFLIGKWADVGFKRVEWMRGAR